MASRRSKQALAFTEDRLLPEFPELREIKTKAKEFKPLNKSQERYVSKIENSTITFGLGPAGTGKSYCAAAVAAKMLKDGSIDKIIISRPAVEAGESLGFLPGDMNEKFDPYVAPIVECLAKSLGKSYVENLTKNGKIVYLPLAFMRGWTFDRAFVILDEAQNVTSIQMKLFLTRIGKDSTVVIDGDTSQRDINVNGLTDAVGRLANVPGVAVHRFSTDDIVRSGIVRDIIKAYSDEPLEQELEGLDRYLKKQ